MVQGRGDVPKVSQVLAVASRRALERGNTMKDLIRAGAFVRVSDKEQVDGYSLEAQREAYAPGASGRD